MAPCAMAVAPSKDSCCPSSIAPALCASVGQSMPRIVPAQMWPGKGSGCASHGSNGAPSSSSSSARVGLASGCGRYWRCCCCCRTVVLIATMRVAVDRKTIVVVYTFVYTVVTGNSERHYISCHPTSHLHWDRARPIPICDGTAAARYLLRFVLRPIVAACCGFGGILSGPGWRITSRILRTRRCGRSSRPN
jgi:hypothetical protein